MAEAKLDPGCLGDGSEEATLPEVFGMRRIEGAVIPVGTQEGEAAQIAETEFTEPSRNGGRVWPDTGRPSAACLGSLAGIA